MVVVIFAGLIHQVGQMVFGDGGQGADRGREALWPLLGLLLLAAVMVLLGVYHARCALTACWCARRRSSLAEPSHPRQELSARLAGLGGLRAGPAPAGSHLQAPARRRRTCRGGRSVRRGAGAGDPGCNRREATAERDVKVRYMFEPIAAGPRPLPDIFVTLVASLDPARPELPSISTEVPRRQLARARGAGSVRHRLLPGTPIRDHWSFTTAGPRACIRCARDSTARAASAGRAGEEFPHLLVEGEGVLEVPVGPIHAGSSSLATSASAQSASRY